MATRVNVIGNPNLPDSKQVDGGHRLHPMDNPTVFARPARG
jgi:hypothetical protein